MQDTDATFSFILPPSLLALTFPCVPYVRLNPSHFTSLGMGGWPQQDRMHVTEGHVSSNATEMISATAEKTPYLTQITGLHYHKQAMAMWQATGAYFWCRLNSPSTYG